ncbi:MAG: DUF5908 family protein [Reichenbachiella sp.]|uniref:DUF5908 family protein n=1 Tax=Reichenbachiella sp. TaxID=2184521 RepID=UPI0032668548
MPLEIKELVIRAFIGSEASETASSEANSSMPSTSAIVADCVEQVMQILKEKEER